MTEPIRISATVPLAPHDAFDLFTARMHTWWPLATHSVFTGDAATCAVEDGRVVERSRSGEESVWGEVVEHDRPHRFVVSWHPGGVPATVVAVTFTASDDGTYVELEHRGWETFERPDEARVPYTTGWAFVFGQRFTAAAAELAAALR